MALSELWQGVNVEGIQDIRARSVARELMAELQRLRNDTIDATNLIAPPKLPRDFILTRNLTNVGNVGAGEDNLMTYAVHPNTFTKTYHGIRITGWGSTAANGNNKRLRVRFGGTLILDSGAVAPNNKNWWVTALILRAATQDQRAMAWGDYNAARMTPTITGLTKDETISLTVAFTGEATSDNDIVQRGLLIEFLDV